MDGNLNTSNKLKKGFSKMKKMILKLKLPNFIRKVKDQDTMN